MSENKIRRKNENTILILFGKHLVRLGERKNSRNKTIRLIRMRVKAMDRKLILERVFLGRINNSLFI